MKKSPSMKAAIFTLILLIVGILSSNAQKREASGKAPAFDVGSASIALSLGFGSDYSYDYDYYYSYSTAPTVKPAFAATIDCGIAKAGPGVIGIGGIVAVQSSAYKYSSGYKAVYRNISIAARGTYHLTILKDRNNKFDPYAGVTFGLRLYNYSDNYYEDSYSSGYIVAGMFVGAKYNFSKHFGAFAEVGYDVSLVRLGLNIDF